MKALLTCYATDIPRLMLTPNIHLLPIEILRPSRTVMFVSSFTIIMMNT